MFLKWPPELSPSEQLIHSALVIPAPGLMIQKKSSFVILSTCFLLLQLSTLKDSVIFDRYTEGNIKSRRLALQKEATELTSYLKQNQDITQTLMNVCQR